MLAVDDVQLVREAVQELEARGRREHARAVQALLEVATSATERRAGGPREYLTTGQAADALGVSRQTIKNWVAAGHLRAAQLGGRTFVHRAEVLAQLEKLQQARPGSKTKERRSAPEAARAERAWQQFLLDGLPGDKVARLEALHEKLEDGGDLSRAERAEMAALERDVTAAARQRLEDWLREQRSP